MNIDNTTLIISYFNCMEMLDLINYFRNKCKIIIYNKGKPIKDISNCIIINKPNVGREANT